MKTFKRALLYPTANLREQFVSLRWPLDLLIINHFLVDLEGIHFQGLVIGYQLQDDVTKCGLDIFLARASPTYKLTKGAREQREEGKNQQQQYQTTITTTTCATDPLPKQQVELCTVHVTRMHFQFQFVM